MSCDENALELDDADGCATGRKALRRAPVTSTPSTSPVWISARVSPTPALREPPPWPECHLVLQVPLLFVWKWARRTRPWGRDRHGSSAPRGDSDGRPNTAVLLNPHGGASRSRCPRLSQGEEEGSQAEPSPRRPQPQHRTWVACPVVQSYVHPRGPQVPNCAGLRLGRPDVPCETGQNTVVLTHFKRDVGSARPEGSAAWPHRPPRRAALLLRHL